MPIKTIIVDDIKKLRESLIGLLELYCPQVNVVDQAATVSEAVSKIQLHNPELVFLDIELGNELVFEIFEQLTTINFKIIFVTAHNDYAIRAFKFSALDYLLKPVDADELIEAVAKAENELSKNQLEERLQAMMVNFMAKSAVMPKKIILKTVDKIFSVEIADIIRCESDKNYTTFYLSNEKKITVAVTLKEYEEMLSLHGFYRTHQSHLVNMTYFDHFIKADGGMLVLKNGMKVPLASRKREDFISLISK